MSQRGGQVQIGRHASQVQLADLYAIGKHDRDAALTVAALCLVLSTATMAGDIGVGGNGDIGVGKNGDIGVGKNGDIGVGVPFILAMLQALSGRG